MENPSYHELTERLAWAKLRVNQLEEEAESWRNQAQLAQAKVMQQEKEIRDLRHRLDESLPLYDPDEYLSSDK